MHPYRNVLVLCMIALFSIMLSSSGVVHAGRIVHQPRARKISHAPWLSAPHFPAFSKRGRFVFRDAPLDRFDDSNGHDLEDLDLYAEKRNWRL